MSNSGNGLKNEGIREISSSSLTTSYQNLGSPILHRAFVVTSFNGTNGEVYLRRSSEAGQDSMRYPVNSGRIKDAKTNDAVEVPGTQFEIKWVGTPPDNPEGDFWLEIEYV
jgi:hypothetical protein